MTLLLTLFATAVVGGGLGIVVLARRGARRDHRCEPRTLVQSCGACAAVARGQGRGGHIVCACGAVSPHLYGIDLLSWRATHHGERLPQPADVADASSQASAAVSPSAAAPARGPASRSVSKTRVHAAEEAEAADFVRMLEERSEAERRAIERARRKPNPITPQLLREAGLSADEADAVIERMRASGDLEQ